VIWRRKASKAGQYLTSRLKPSEALWLRRNPLIVGLVSVLIGSTDLEDIEAFCAAAILRGTKIQEGTLSQDDQINLNNQGREGLSPP
jgi:hypothetical protein